MKLALVLVAVLACKNHEPRPTQQGPVVEPPVTPTIAIAVDAAELGHVEVDAGCDEDAPLTAAGKRREAWVEDLTKTMSSGDPIHDWDYGVTIVAGGCDATTLLVAAGAHSGGGCDEAALRNTDRDLHKLLKKYGFAKLTCSGPDGPEIMVR